MEKLPPSTIHQIWLQGTSTVPKEYQKFSETIKLNNPNFNHILWDEDKFRNKILNQFPKYKHYYEKLPLIHLKVDYMRYIILFIFGGIYVDMDARAIRSFNTIKKDIEKYETILGKLNRSKTESLFFTGKQFMVNNGIIISKKNSLFLKELLKHVEESIDRYETELSNPNMKEKMLSNTGTIDKITGPVAFTNVYFSIPEILRNEKVKL